MESKLQGNSQGLITEVYCTGVSKPNPGPGAASMVCLTNRDTYEEWDCVYRGDTTSQRMELLSLHITLCRVYEEANLFAPSITINTDSPYIRRGVTGWVNTWALNDWKKRGGNGEIANLDLWQSIYYLLRVKDLPEIKWNWEKSKGTLIALSHCMRVIDGGLWVGKTGGNKWQHHILTKPSPAMPIKLSA